MNKKYCVWTTDGKNEWYPSCYEWTVFNMSFLRDTPILHDYIYCPKCGNPIKVKK